MIVWPAGLLTRWLADAGPSHQMGHAVAGLCDETADRRGVHPLHDAAEIECANASAVHDPARVPWTQFIGDISVPTRHRDGSLGVYEGADGYFGGAYRPSFDSTMRNLAPLFNAPSRAALEAAMQARTGSRRSEADTAGRCARVPHNAVHRRDVDC